MPANTVPIFSLTPNLSAVSITTASANTASAGAGTVGTNMFLAFTAGANGSFVQKVRFMSVASAAGVTGVATVLRIFLSTVNSGSPTAANTFLIGEVSVPAINSANQVNATNFYDFPLNIAIQTGYYILVSQHVAQTTNQNWNAMVFGGNY
jgi:hypothetical protein